MKSVPFRLYLCFILIFIVLGIGTVSLQEIIGDATGSRVAEYVGAPDSASVPLAPAPAPMPIISQPIPSASSGTQKPFWEELTEEKRGEPKFSFDIAIPRIGTFILKGTLDLDVGKYYFTGALKDPQPLILGALVLAPPSAAFSSQFGLQVHGNASLFGKKYLFSLDKFIPGQDLIFSLLGEQPLEIPILPWKKLTFKKLYLSLGLKTQRLFVRTSLFSKSGQEDTELSIGLDNADGFLEAKVREIRLSSIIPQFEKTILDSVVTRDVLIQVSKLFKSPTLKLASTTDFTELGSQLPVKLDLGKVATSLTISSIGQVTFDAKLGYDKPIYPFKELKIPGLEDVNIKNVGLGFDLKQKLLYLYGTGTLLNVSTTLCINKFPDFLLVTANLAKGWKISEAIPAAKGTPLDELDLSGAQFIVSTKSYRDEKLNLDIKKGINLVANIPLLNVVLKNIKDEEQRAQIAQTLSKMPTSLQIVGSIGTSLPDLMLTVNIPMQLGFEIPKGPAFYIQRMAARISGDGPSASVLASIGVRPTPQDQLLEFTGAFQMGVQTASLAASMKGMWVDPLGIATLLRLKRDKLAIFDLGLELGIDYKIFPASGVPTVFGITGGLKIGDAIARMALKATSDIADLVLLGELYKEAIDPKTGAQVIDPGTGKVKHEMIKLKDIVKFANDLGIMIPVNNIPEFGYMGEIRFCPKGARIGEIYIEPGISCRGEIIMPNFFRIFDPQAPENFFAMVDMSLSLEGGVKAVGALSTIKIGDFFMLTGAGMDKKYGTTDDGPIFSMKLTPLEQEFYLSGKLKVGNDKWGIFKTESQTEGIFNKDGLKFMTKTSLFGGMVEVALDMKTIGKDLLSTTDFVVHGDFKDDFRDFVEKKIIKKINDIQANVRKDFDKANADLVWAQSEVAKLQTQIKALYDAQGNKAKMCRRITDAQREVDKINIEIDNTQREINGLNFWTYGAMVWLGPKIAALWSAHKAAMGVLQWAKVIAGAIEGLDPRIVPLETAEFTARETLRVAQAAVQNTKEGIIDIGDATKDVTNTVGGIFKLQKASLDFKMSELVYQGKMPLIKFDAVILGKQLKNQEIQIDFNKPDQFFNQIAQIALKVLKK
ncbi:MAG: hypothetical protein ABH827_03540 [bacterium]